MMVKKLLETMFFVVALRHALDEKMHVTNPIRIMFN